MLVQTIVDYIENYMTPIPVVEPTAPTEAVQHAIDYFNANHGETKYADIVPSINAGQNSAVYDMSGLSYNCSFGVIECMPKVSNLVSEVGSVDNVSDLILLNWSDRMLTGGSGQYRDMTQLVLTRNFLAYYKQYFNLRFDWRFINGRLVFHQIPPDCQSIFVAYRADIPSHPIQVNYDITDPFAYMWVKEYALGLYQLRQGEILAKGTTVGLDVQGSNIKNEGLATKERLENILADTHSMPLIR